MTHYLIERLEHEPVPGHTLLCGYRMRCAPGVWMVEGAWTPDSCDSYEIVTRTIDAREYHERMFRADERRLRKRRWLHDRD